MEIADDGYSLMPKEQSVQMCDATGEAMKRQSRAHKEKYLLIAFASGYCPIPAL